MSSLLYVLKTGANYYKIGLASEIKSRISQLQTGCPTPIETVALHDVIFPKKIEALSHREMKQYAIRGEWFEVPDDRIDEFLAEVSDLVARGNTGDLNYKEEETELIKTVRAAILRSGFSSKTEQAYIHWISRFQSAFQGAHPTLPDVKQIQKFIENLRNSSNYSESTLRQAFHAIVFWFENVLKIPVGRKLNSKICDSKIRPAIHVIPREQILKLIEQVPTTYRLQTMLLYGCGLRLMECLSIRVGDVDVESHEISIRDTKGQLSRKVPIPATLFSLLLDSLRERELIHSLDVPNDGGYTLVPSDTSLSKKPSNNLEWQYLFCLTQVCRDPITKLLMRPHADPKAIQKAIKAAVKKLKLDERTTPRTLRHSFAVHMLEKGSSLSELQARMGHSEISTTALYLPLAIRQPIKIISPLDDD